MNILKSLKWLIFGSITYRLRGFLIGLSIGFAIGLYVPSTFAQSCGDGVIDTPPETCDDGNNINGDGCSSICVASSNWYCINEPSECRNLKDCGNGIIDVNEQCDDGNKINYDGCDAICDTEEDYYCDDSEPTICTKGITCYMTCDMDPTGESFIENASTCGEGPTQLFPLDKKPFCPSVWCYKPCSDGGTSQIFPYGTICGQGEEAQYYPLTSKEYCLDYYPFACNEYYFSLCKSAPECTNLGGDYEFINGQCIYTQGLDPQFQTETDALNEIIKQLQKSQSSQLSQVRILQYLFPIITFLIFFVIVIVIIYKTWVYLFNRR